MTNVEFSKFYGFFFFPQGTIVDEDTQVSILPNGSGSYAGPEEVKETLIFRVTSNQLFRKREER